MSEKFSTEWIAEQRELIEGAEELPYVVDDTVIGVPLDDCATRIVADVRKGNNRKYLLAAGNNYPDLLDEIERLQARVTELEAESLPHLGTGTDVPGTAWKPSWEQNDRD